MIGESTAAYIFIRDFVLFLRSIAPLSIVYCCIRPVLLEHLRVPRYLEITAIAESLFYLLVLLPWRYLLQRPVIHPASLSRSARQELFR